MPAESAGQWILPQSAGICVVGDDLAGQEKVKGVTITVSISPSSNSLCREDVSIFDMGISHK